MTEQDEPPVLNTTNLRAALDGLPGDVQGASKLSSMRSPLDDSIRHNTGVTSAMLGTITKRR